MQIFSLTDQLGLRLCVWRVRSLICFCVRGVQRRINKTMRWEVQKQKQGLGRKKNAIPDKLNESVTIGVKWKIVWSEEKKFLSQCSTLRNCQLVSCVILAVPVEFECMNEFASFIGRWLHSGIENGCFCRTIVSTADTADAQLRRLVTQLDGFKTQSEWFWNKNENSWCSFSFFFMFKTVRSILRIVFKVWI